MITLEQAAHRVITEGNKQEECVVDPITIMLLCSILSTIFSSLHLYCQWKQGNQAGESIKQACINSSVMSFPRLRVRHIVRQKLGMKEFRKSGPQLVDRILKVGADASSDELQCLFDQYSGRKGIDSVEEV